MTYYFGGTGFVGSALANRLKQEMKTVHSIGRHDAGRLEQALPQCNTVVHLATTSIARVFSHVS